MPEPFLEFKLGIEPINAHYGKTTLYCANSDGYSHLDPFKCRAHIDQLLVNGMATSPDDSQYGSICKLVKTISDIYEYVLQEAIEGRLTYAKPGDPMVKE